MRCAFCAPCALDALGRTILLITKLQDGVGDAGRPTPAHAELDQQHGPATAGYGPAGGGEAAARGGAAGEKGDSGRPPPANADLDR
eukprot:scaffold72177_cov60-Phaeocystis_antarctica.AAC.2